MRPGGVEVQPLGVGAEREEHTIRAGALNVMKGK
jgi:hypothetical protein